MKKSRIFIALGATVLAIAGVLATKANRKFTAFHTAYAKTSGAIIEVIAPSPLGFTVTNTLGVTAYFQTVSGNLFTLYSTPTSTKKAYYF